MGKGGEIRRQMKDTDALLGDDAGSDAPSWECASGTRNNEKHECKQVEIQSSRPELSFDAAEFMNGKKFGKYA